MKYKTKLIFLISLITACVLILIAGFVFDPQNMNARTSLYTWLDKTWIDQADRLVLKSAGLNSELVMLTRKNNVWHVLADGNEYPAKQERVTDLFNALSAKAAYPVAAWSSSSHAKLGVTEQAASRIILYGGASTIPLLDLLIGSGNSAGNEIYLRKNGNTEVRSGADQFTFYSDAKQNAWFDLRLIHYSRPLTSAMVQNITVAQNNEEQESSYTLSRFAGENGTSWRIDSFPAMLVDNAKAESYVRSLLTSEAADFAAASLPSDYDFSFGKIELLLDDLSSLSIFFAPALENGQHPAMSSGSPFVYLIPEWTAERMLREADYFAEEM